MSNLLAIYNTQEIQNMNTTISEEINFKIWKPSLINIIPPFKNWKYVLFWLYHYLGVFGNKNYFYVQALHNQKLAGSLMVVPSFYKWKFMKRKDVQFMYVMTAEAYRGHGIAGTMIEFASRNCSNVGEFWYVTSEQNLASRKVAEKIGFAFFSYGKRVGLFKKIISTNS